MKKILAMILFALLLVSTPTRADDGYPCGGHFETRYKTVLVCAPRYERVWVEPIYNDGILVQVGYWRDVMVPGRYEKRLVQVWIPERHGGGTFNLGVTWNWKSW